MTPRHHTVQEGLSMVSCREGITCLEFVIPSLSLSIYAKLTGRPSLYLVSDAVTYQTELVQVLTFHEYMIQDNFNSESGPCCY